MSDYVFNSACVAELVGSADQARQYLAALLRGIAAFEAEEETLPTLRLDTDPWLLNIANEARVFSIAEIAQQMYDTSDHDVAAFFEALATTMPSDVGLGESVIDSILTITPDAAAAGVEDAYEATLASGVHGVLCALADFILISLQTSELWRFDRMGFQVSGENYYFDHLTNSTHSAAVRLRRRNALRADLGISNFWRFRNRAFPNLRFGLDLEVHMRHFSARLFPLALKRLAELDERVRRWKDSGSIDLPQGPTAITPETPQTMANYGTSRRFRGHDGVTRTFEDHMWIDKGHRIHLIRNTAERVVEVGYIGKHLPTMNYPT